MTPNGYGETINLADEYPEMVQEMNLLMQDARTPSEIFPFNPCYIKK